MIQTIGLQFSYPNTAFSGDNSRQFAFPDITCAQKELLLILGQSGCGKTTLLHLLAGLLKAQSGNIIIKGEDIAAMGESQLDLYRGANIGVVFQQSHLLKSLTVAQNLLAAQYLANKTQNLPAIEELLVRLNLGHKLHSPSHQLSVGEQQRVAIARALINRPALILADEPTSNLDDRNCEEVINLLAQQAQDFNAALVVVTHDGRLKERVKNRIELDNRG